MQLEQQHTRDNYINNYSEDSITINGINYRSTVVVTPKQVFTDWPIDSMAQLNGEYCQRLIEFHPQVIIIGNEEGVTLLPPELMHAFGRQGIGVECMPLDAACRTYNLLVHEGRVVMGVLLLPAS
ncbi:MAG: Mth938-like domain-containing protein [Gammaproteobacteria bacterium]